MMRWMVAAALLAGTAGLAQAQDRGLAQGVQGRPHDGNFAETMELRRHHMSRAQYDGMRARNRRMQARMSRRHHM